LSISAEKFSAINFFVDERISYHPKLLPNICIRHFFNTKAFQKICFPWQVELNCTGAGQHSPNYWILNVGTYICRCIIIHKKTIITNMYQP
jgi:hypothetical protein